jgi:MSHA type pilus biogenesis protein MshL
MEKSKKVPPHDLSVQQLIAESEELDQRRKEYIDTLEKKKEKKLDIQPVMPVYDPLEEHVVSFSMVDENFQMVLYSLARSVGMNLIIDADITKDNRLLTLNFEKVTASKALKEILNTFDLFYEIEENVIRVKPFQEQIFKLDFLDTDITTTFDMGGSVLGEGGATAATGLSGTFRLTGKGAKTGSPYNMIEETVKKLLSPKGKFALDRLSGTLYVKDTPASIHAVSRFVNQFKKSLARQILIEARIIEVTLLDEFKYGIDWSFVRDTAANAEMLTKASWSIGSGLVLSHSNNDIFINPLDEAINALQAFGDGKVISNPSIRSKHGKPAILSVGTSLSYKKSVETTRTGTGRDFTQETNVEVSTVFDGLILGVIPFVEEDGRISLLINPIISDVEPESLELQVVGEGQSISLPIVHVKELNTTISLNSGDVVMLGGLIDKQEATGEKGFPILMDIPILGYLFKYQFDTEEIRELVIILSVTSV